MKLKIQDERLGTLADQNHLTGKQEFPAEIIQLFKRRIFQISQAKDLQDLRAIKSLHFEKLKEKRYEDKYSIRLNKSYRLILSLDKDEMSIVVVVIEEITNHYG